jgi:hypothetical protein
MSEIKNIGVTENSLPIVKKLEDDKVFSEKRDIAMFAIAVALKDAGDSPPDLSGISPSGTKWAVGAFDETGDLKRLLTSIYPDCEDVYATAQELIEIGLRTLDENNSSPVQLVIDAQKGGVKSSR